MAQWCEAAELERWFIVTQTQLQAYAFRGNLSARRLGDGSCLYDVADVARLFRRRHAAEQAGSDPTSLASEPGTLGLLRLGDRWGRPR